MSKSDNPSTPATPEPAALDLHIDPNIGTIKPQEITEEMRRSYLDYAMSVIVSRALPDVRDGLKPVQRRILVTLKDLNLSPGAKHRKSAKIAGDVSGNYHPHGEMNIYPAMVRLAQPFSLRYPLVDGQGNFGSIDGDGAAAMRYTEARMTHVSDLLLTDIEKDTVDYIPNYDNTRTEPVVLPAAVPHLLLNGTVGIAVGMASNIPPHNIGEIIDATVAVIDKPDLDLEELVKLVPGPDFPTAAQIYGQKGIREAYATGRGRVVIRGVAEIIEAKSGKQSIIISELPYQVNKAELVLKIADLVRDKKLDGISDIRDESDRQGIRVVIELKKGSYPKKILNRLFTLTPLQTAFHINMVALVDGIEPRTLSLKEVLEQFIAHRIQVVTRRSQYDLQKALDRAHILEGLLTALDSIDEVVDTIRKSKTREEAHGKLMTKFKLSEVQANAILDMRLATLVGLERDRLQAELDEKRKLIEYLQAILADEGKLRGLIKDELESIRKTYGDKRRTVIFPQELGSFTAEDLIPNERVLVTLTKTNYVKRVSIAEYHSQGRGGKGVVGMATKSEDEIQFTCSADTHDDILFFTDRGRLFKTKVYELPAVSRQAKGSAIANVIQIAPDEKVTAVLAAQSKIWTEGTSYLIMGTEKGVVKKTLLKLYQNVRATGIRAINLLEGDNLRWVAVSSGEDTVAIVTVLGQSIVFSEKDIRPMGRTASGVRGIKLRSADRVVAMITTKGNPEDDLENEVLVVTENGFGKRTPLNNYNLQKRGGVGIKASDVTKRTGQIIDAQVVSDLKAQAVLTSRLGQVIKMPLKQVKKLGRVTQGVTLMRFKQADTVASVAVVAPEQTEETLLS
jgi:DNA gyrase subunit A